eukprot:5085445-Amphidinium_carterae.1
MTQAFVFESQKGMHRNNHKEVSTRRKPKIVRPLWKNQKKVKQKKQKDAKVLQNIIVCALHMCVGGRYEKPNKLLAQRDAHGGSRLVRCTTPTFPEASSYPHSAKPVQTQRRFVSGEASTKRPHLKNVKTNARRKK